MTLKGLILIATSLLIAGCASSGSLSREMAELQDEHVSTVVDVWGQPDTQETFGQETVLIWYDRAPAAFDMATSVIVCERMLAVTAEGTITGWRWRGDHCETVPAGMRARSLTAARQDLDLLVPGPLVGQ